MNRTGSRSTWLRKLRARGVPIAPFVLAAVWRADGRVEAAAALLGITSRNLRQHLWREALWGEVHAARAAAAAARRVYLPASMAQAAREALRAPLGARRVSDM